MNKTASQIADDVLEKIALSPGKAYQALLQRGSSRGGLRGGLSGLESRYPRTFTRMQSAARKAPSQQVFDPAARQLGGKVDKSILREGVSSPIRGNRAMEYQTTPASRSQLNTQLEGDIQKYKSSPSIFGGASPEGAIKAKSQLHQADAELAGSRMDWADSFGDVR